MCSRGSTGAERDRSRSLRVVAMSADPLRVCARCRVSKPLAEFPIKNAAKGWYRSYCRPCCSEYGKEHYQKNPAYYLAKNHVSRARSRQTNRDLVFEYLLTHPCVDCGEKNVVVLDFDHVDSATKRSDVGSMLSRRTTSAVRREMQKCVIRCANCHRRRTAVQFNFPNPLRTSHGAC
jgi:hypothetical protein